MTECPRLSSSDEELRFLTLKTQGDLRLSNYSRKVGTVVDITCYEPFKLVGEKRLKCLSTGAWDKSAPKCKMQGKGDVDPSPSPMTPVSGPVTIIIAVACSVAFLLLVGFVAWLISSLRRSKKTDKENDTRIGVPLEDYDIGAMGFTSDRKQNDYVPTGKYGLAANRAYTNGVGQVYGGPVTLGGSPLYENLRNQRYDGNKSRKEHARDNERHGRRPSDYSSRDNMLKMPRYEGIYNANDGPRNQDMNAPRYSRYTNDLNMYSSRQTAVDYQHYDRPKTNKLMGHAYNQRLRETDRIFSVSDRYYSDENVSRGEVERHRTGSYRDFSREGYRHNRNQVYYDRR